MQGPTDVGIADDHGIVREGLRRLIGAESDMHYAGDARDGEGACELVQREHIDVLVLDNVMPRLGGLEAVAKIRRRSRARPS